MCEETRKTIENAEIGYTFTPHELNQQCVAIHGAVAWPGKRPGFAVVIGMTRYDKMHILEEYESDDLLDLVKKCGVLNFKYNVFKSYSYVFSRYRWFGDYKNTAAADFVYDMNRETKPRVQLDLNRSLILDDDENLYQFILAKLKGEYLKTTEKRLFLKESRVKNCLSGFEPSEIYKMKVGDYPAIEAVAIAAIELQYTVDQSRRLANQGPPKSAYSKGISPLA